MDGSNNNINKSYGNVKSFKSSTGWYDYDIYGKA